MTKTSTSLWPRTAWERCWGHRKLKHLVYVLGEPRHEVVLHCIEAKSLGLQTWEPGNSIGLYPSIVVTRYGGRSS